MGEPSTSCRLTHIANSTADDLVSKVLMTSLQLHLVVRKKVKSA